MPFWPRCYYSVESDTSFCLSCGTSVEVAHRSETIHPSARKKVDVLEERPRRVILLEDNGASLQSILERASRPEEAPTQARSRRAELEEKVRALEGKRDKLIIVTVHDAGVLLLPAILAPRVVGGNLPPSDPITILV